jgi:hypothetical protein
VIYSLVGLHIDVVWNDLKFSCSGHQLINISILFWKKKQDSTLSICLRAKEVSLFCHISCS